MEYVLSVQVLQCQNQTSYYVFWGQEGSLLVSLSEKVFCLLMWNLRSPPSKYSISKYKLESFCDAISVFIMNLSRYSVGYLLLTISTISLSIIMLFILPWDSILSQEELTSPLTFPWVHRFASFCGLGLSKPFQMTLCPRAAGKHSYFWNCLKVQLEEQAA